MIFELRILLRTLILPPACLLIIGVLGLVPMWRYRRLGMALTGAALAALWLLSTPSIADGLERAAERRMLR